MSTLLLLVAAERGIVLDGLLRTHLVDELMNRIGGVSTLSSSSSASPQQPDVAVLRPSVTDGVSLHRVKKVLQAALHQSRVTVVLWSDLLNRASTRAELLSSLRVQVPSNTVWMMWCSVVCSQPAKLSFWFGEELAAAVLPSATARPDELIQLHGDALMGMKANDRVMSIRVRQFENAQRLLTLRVAHSDPEALIPATQLSTPATKGRPQQNFPSHSGKPPLPPNLMGKLRIDIEKLWRMSDEARQRGGDNVTSLQPPRVSVMLIGVNESFVQTADRRGLHSVGVGDSRATGSMIMLEPQVRKWVALWCANRHHAVAFVSLGSHPSGERYTTRSLLPWWHSAAVENAIARAASEPAKGRQMLSPLPSQSPPPPPAPAPAPTTTLRSETDVLHLGRLYPMYALLANLHLEDTGSKASSTAALLTAGPFLDAPPLPFSATLLGILNRVVGGAGIDWASSVLVTELPSSASGLNWLAAVAPELRCVPPNDVLPLLQERSCPPSGRAAGNGAVTVEAAASASDVIDGDLAKWSDAEWSWFHSCSSSSEHVANCDASTSVCGPPAATALPGTGPRPPSVADIPPAGASSSSIPTVTEASTSLCCIMAPVGVKTIASLCWTSPVVEALHHTCVDGRSFCCRLDELQTVCDSGVIQISRRYVRDGLIATDNRLRLSGYGADTVVAETVSFSSDRTKTYHVELGTTRGRIAFATCDCGSVAPPRILCRHVVALGIVLSGIPINSVPPVAVRASTASHTVVAEQSTTAPQPPAVLPVVKSETDPMDLALHGCYSVTPVELGPGGLPLHVMGAAATRRGGTGCGGIGGKGAPCASTASASPSSNKIDWGPSAPKRKRVTPFFFFVRQRRPLLIAAEPTLKPTEVTKKLGEVWRALSEAERQVVVDACREEAAAIDAEWAAFRETDAYKAVVAARQAAQDAQQQQQAVAHHPQSPVDGIDVTNSVDIEAVPFAAKHSEWHWDENGRWVCDWDDDGDDGDTDGNTAVKKKPRLEARLGSLMPVGGLEGGRSFANRRASTAALMTRSELMEDDGASSCQSHMFDDDDDENDDEEN